MPRLRFIAILGFLVSIPAFAGSKNCSDISITSLTANDANTGEIVTINWAYSGAPLTSQTITINDWNVYPIDSLEQRSTTHLPTHSGTFKVRLDATSACGSTSATTTFKVDHCALAEPKVSLSTDLLQPFGILDARLHLPSGYTATWHVTYGGTLLSENGETAQFQVDSHGPLQFYAIVTSPEGCTVLPWASVDVDRELCAPGIGIMPTGMWGACPGQPATATLWEPVPDGASVVWYVDGGEVTGGQGTDHVTYLVNGPTGDMYRLNVFLEFPDGCSSYKTDLTMPIHGAPETSISLSSPSIQAGESTTIYLKTSYVSGVDFYAENGDSIEPIYSDTPQICCRDNVYPYKYTSTHGPGTSTIRSFVTGMCGGTAEASTTLEILP